MPFDIANFPQSDNVLDLLYRARDRIARPDGWCQGDYMSEDRVCLLGALIMELDDFEGDETKIWTYSVWLCYNTLYNLLQKELPAGYPDRGLGLYNDTEGRTQDEIVALFDRAIATWIKY